MQTLGPIKAGSPYLVPKGKEQLLEPKERPVLTKLVGGRAMNKARVKKYPQITFLSPF